MGIVLGAVIAVLLVGFVIAQTKASARLAGTFQTHRPELAIPFPLSPS